MTAKTSTERGSSTQETGPGKQIQPYWDKLLSGASGAFDTAVNAVQAPFTGELFAPATEAQREAIASMKAVAPGLAQGAGDVRNLATRIASGEFLDVANNPYFQNAAKSVSDNVTRALKMDWLPAATDKARAQGAYGGSGTDATNARLIEAAAGKVADANANLATNYFNTGAGMTGQIPGLFNQAGSMAIAPAEAMAAAGAAERGFSQEELAAALQKYQMSLQDPAAQLAPYAAFANLLNAPGYRSTSGTSLKETTTPAPDLATMILQGTLGAGSLAMGLGTGMPGMITGFKTLGNLFKPSPGGMTSQGLGFY